MAGLRDEELIRIAYSSEDEGYVSSALAAASEELARRGVSATDRSRVIEEIIENQEFENKKHLLHLRTRERIAFGFFGPLFARRWGPEWLDARGYHQKSQDAREAIFWGYVCWAGVSVPICIFLMWR